MYVPPKSHTFGRYYEVSLIDGENAQITQKQMYNNWYYSSAEYYSGFGTEYPVWAYAEDYVEGFMTLTYNEGNYNQSNTPISLSMNDIAYDYHADRMIGVKYGRIYKVMLNGDRPGSSELIYDYADHNDLKPIAIACDLDGCVYFVSTSTDGTETSKLYKFAANDTDMENYIEVGDLGWPARSIQTMAFNHKTRELFWWACDKDGNSQLKRVNKETAECEDLTDVLTTEMAGLIFEFDYRPYNVTCINEEGEILLDQDSYDNSHVFNKTTSGYYPAKDVEFRVEAPECASIDSIVVMYAGAEEDNEITEDEIIAVFHTEDLVFVPKTGAVPTGYQGYPRGYYYGRFVMPAEDVEIDGFWIGNEHNVNLVWTPASLVDALTMEGTTALCGDEVFVTYDHPEGYYLKDVVVTCGEDELEVTVHADDSQISFVMCDDDVTVTATYVTTTLTQIQDICQWNTLKRVPNASHNLGLGHKHKYTFTDPDGGEHFFGDGVMNNNQVDAILGSYVFEVAGEWAYTTIFVSSTYGDFTSTTRYFYVHEAPHSIAIQEWLYEVETYTNEAGVEVNDTVVRYNAHYNCDGDSIHLEVVTPQDPEYEFNGTFTWKKNNEVIATTTEPRYVINPCSTEDAGIYTVAYVPNSTAEATNANEAPCTFEVDFEVNVATLPNNPPIEYLEGSNPICYNSEAVLHWVHGNLNPQEYTCVWYLVIDDEWIEITERNLADIEGYEFENFEFEDDVLVASQLKTNTTFGLSIYYRGDYFNCHSESEPFTVEVKETSILEITGDDMTCRGFNPANNPMVEGDFEDFVWKFDGTVIAGVTGNELVFEDNAQLSEFLQEAGEHVIDVEATDVDGCVIYGTMPFIINELPDVALANNINDEVAHPDHTVTIEICSGDYIELTASGADEYRWGDAKDGGTTTESTMTLQPLNSMTYSVSGKSEETGCWNTTTIIINVNPLPEITWVNPASDYSFSMMTTNFPLEATPAGGIFAYIIDGDPDEIDYPIVDADGNPTNLFNPSQVGIGNYQLVYSYQDPETGCQSEAKINIEITKPYWTDKGIRDEFWYQDCLEAHRWEITNNEQLGAFAAYLNYYNLEPEDQEGIDFYDFAEDTVWITNNIDLLYDYDEITGEPIEQFYFYRPLNEFKGVLDGTGKVVTNMTILEDELDMNVSGFIRNLGIKDASITSTFAPCVVDVLEDAKFHNSYITMPTLVNVTPNFRPSGEVRNVYYYGPMPGAKAISSIYVDNAVVPPVVISPIAPETLLHGTMPNFEGILEEWVWIQNDFAYRTWITDFPNEEDWINYGYPVMNEQFIHHHYVEANYCDYIDTLVMEGVSTRTINGEDYVYAMAGDNITVTYTPESDYIVIDSIKVTAHEYYTDFGSYIDSTFIVEGPAYSFSFLMPVDSIYLPAYWLDIEPYCRRDYWTDEGNYDAEWFDHIQAQSLPFDVHTNEELAAVAYMCDFGGYNFEGDTIHIVGSENAENEDPCLRTIIDMAGHYWRPIYNFKGVIDGQKYIVENLFIREEISAMFVDCEGSIINFGIKDIDLPEEGETAIYIYNTEDTQASLLNSFATIDPAKQVYYPLAVGDGVVVENSYTLDEGGNMVDNEGNGGIDLLSLNEWVIAQSAENPLIFFDWKLDDCDINYGYPVHNQQYDGGWAIIYDPDIHTPNNGYVTGINENGENAITGHTGEIITVTPYPEWCYDLSSLTVDLGEDGGIVDISDTKQFTMPNHSVTVTAVFAPKNWKLTVFHKDMNGKTLAPQDVYTMMHYQDEILIDDYAIDDPNFEYELVPDTVMLNGALVNQDTEMPCGNKQLTIYYQGKLHNIDFCESDYEMAINPEDEDDVEASIFIYTDPQDEARYTETVTLNIHAEDGISITGLEILDAAGTPVAYNTVEYGTYTFVMPTSDVTICPTFAEKYWDDYMIADPSWYFSNPTATSYEITTDSMLGGLAALVTGRTWLLEHWTEFEHPEGYELTEDVLANLTFEGVTITLNSSQEEGEINLIEHKWRPIGAQIEFLKQFQGTFDGNGHIITNMTTTHLYNYNDERDGACQGLFGVVGGNGVVNDVNIQGIAEGRYFTAGIAAVNYGIIMNCVSDVEVRSEFQAGGIVCNNFEGAYLVNSYCISSKVECTSADATKGGDQPTNNYYVGGVASYNSGVIMNCHSVAELVKGNGSNPIHYYGGVVGMNDGEVSKCYWTGSWPCVGGGTNGANCSKINNNTYSTMTATAQQLNSSLGLDFDLFTWINSTTTPKYPVFDPNNRSTMTITENDFNVSIYPNPTKGDVKIVSESIQRVSVFNMFGQLILETEVNGNETMLHMNGLAAGVYMVKITTNNGVATRNIIVE